MIDRAYWHRCDRCAEPIEPRTELLKRSVTAGSIDRAVTIYLHPGSWAGCLVAVKRLADADRQRAIGRVMARVTVDPVTARGIPPSVTRRCDHRGGSCLDRLDAEQLQAGNDDLEETYLWQRYLAGDR